MTILLVLVPISLALLGLAIWAFLWAVKSGQYDDLDSPSIDMLRDDPKPVPPAESAKPDDA
ncbi:MAG: cytochrome oxidase maturation protein, cbb3-type [Gammaproteobacteria bacterium RIFCSPHIGHO2_12_FULL_63_22]|nr:MAG: cytochrome oxidase maturation protein, cbb3-type [Gammaproteobacteria bacterium RIFCSPHIGHO2_12_FULL_63_22]